MIEAVNPYVCLDIFTLAEAAQSIHWLLGVEIIDFYARTRHDYVESVDVHGRVIQLEKFGAVQLEDQLSD